MTEDTFVWLVVTVGLFGGVWYASSATIYLIGRFIKWLKRKIDLNFAEMRTLIISKYEVKELQANNSAVLDMCVRKMMMRYKLNRITYLKCILLSDKRILKIWYKK